MSDINMGTLYNMNKAVILQNLKKEDFLCSQELAEKLSMIKQFCLDTKNKYFMLLNREKYDFTLFNLENKCDDFEINRIFYDELRECLQNRGKLLSIDLTEGKDACEIWIVTDDEAFVYYLFPYDNGVIE